MQGKSSVSYYDYLSFHAYIVYDFKKNKKMIKKE